jgi:hypothetical protein
MADQSDEDLCGSERELIRKTRPPNYKWQPIETAPRTKDFIAHLGNGYITRARFISGKFFAADSMGEGKGNTEPTHWMPLPDPPK